MTYSDIKRLLKKNGCYLKVEGKRHELWYSPITGNTFTVARHDTQEVKNGTLQSIKRAAGLK